MINCKSFFKIVFSVIFIFIIYQTVLLYTSENKIPNFSYLDLNNKIVKGASLPQSKTVFIFFYTECNYCNVTIYEIKKLAINRKDINYVFITEEKDITSIKAYIKQNNIDKITPYMDMQIKITV